MIGKCTSGAMRNSWSSEPNTQNLPKPSESINAYK